MNKFELTKRIALQMAITHKDALHFMKAFEKVFEESVTEGIPIALQGFGTFHIWQQTERQGRNPKTGIPAQIRARNSVKFKPGKNLLKALNQK